MDLLKMNKTQLLEKCTEFGIIKCSSKNKTQLIELIQSHQKPESKPIQEIPAKETKENQFKFIDLFCGIGGFHQALKILNGECVFACDIDANCRKTYETNYGLKPESDITKVDINAIPDFDVLCGGFPCQPFSKAGFQMGFDDPSGRGNLFFNICAIVHHKKPKYLILENVRNLASHDDGNTWKVIYKSLDDLGYYTYELPVILNVLHFNVPQNRERVIIMCKRKDLGPLPILPKIPKSYKKTLTTTISDFISQKKEETEEPDTKKYKITGKMKEVETVWNEFIDLLFKNQIAMPKFPIWSDWWDNEYEATDPFYIKYTSWIDKNREFYTVNKAILQPWLTKSREEKTEWKGAVRKFEWQAGDLKENDSLNTMLWTARGSGIRVKQCDYIPTLVAMAMIPVYGPESRKLTPRELLRLQSFPDTFQYEEKHIGKQVGNAVNVKMIERCAKFLILDEPLF